MADLKETASALLAAPATDTAAFARSETALTLVSASAGDIFSTTILAAAPEAFISSDVGVLAATPDVTKHRMMGNGVKSRSRVQHSCIAAAQIGNTRSAQRVAKVTATS